MNTVKKMRKVKSTAIELQCENCGRWWMPIRQPPAAHVKTCSDRCRVAKLASKYLHTQGEK